MNPFGLTSPCAKIAKAFGVPQWEVDHDMEWLLFIRGIRKEMPWHTRLYAGKFPPSIQTLFGVWTVGKIGEPRQQILLCLQAVITEMIGD
jgi:hypothetical protein